MGLLYGIIFLIRPLLVDVLHNVLIMMKNKKKRTLYLKSMICVKNFTLHLCFR